MRSDPSANAAPKFPDEDDTAGTADPITIDDIDENTTGAIGDPVTATDADNDIRVYSLVTVDPNDDANTDYQDSADFTIDSRSGQISVKAGTTLDFENPTGGGGSATNNAYLLTVKATDPSDASDMVAVTINVVNVDEAPTGLDDKDANDDGTDDQNPTEVTAEEGSSPGLSQAYTATDPEDTSSLTWSVSDTDNFTITGGTLAFVSGVEPDHEEQSEYVITITVRGDNSAEGTASASIEVTVTINDAAEDGTVTLSAREPQAGKAVTASLEEMDDNPTSIQWRWGTVATTGECADSLFETGGTFCGRRTVHIV